MTEPVEISRHSFVKAIEKDAINATNSKRLPVPK